ncbi:ABC transporter ATP-binding protein [Myxococcota bacterium]
MIRVDALTFTYPGTREPAVSDLSFEVPRGEIFGLLGPSGAGKSTTVNLLIGLLRGHRGTIEVLGSAPATQGPDYYERIGVSFELPNHFGKLTARENLDYFRGLYSGNLRTARETLELVQLEEHADKPVSDFSKGMKNRLTLARSLLHRPQLLFLDEPTSGLDPVIARHIRRLIQSQRDQGTTVLLTTHNMADADELCDRVGFIVEGRLAALDAPASLAKKYGRRTVRVEYDSEGQTRSEEFPLDGLADDTRFLDLLRTHRVERLHSQETSLEEVFAVITGRALS